MEVRHLDSSFAAANADFVSERRTGTAHEPVVVWTVRNWLNVVIQSDVGEYKLQLLGCEVTAWAVDFMLAKAKVKAKDRVNYQACLP
jgi:hypothetical protein